MKKIQLLILLTLSLTFIQSISTVSADSGACSYHGGVNCSAGPNSYGSAICKDGFESSVSYYSMQECRLDPCDVGYGLNQILIYSKLPSQESRDFEKKINEALIKNEDQFVQKIENDLNSSIQEINQSYSSQQSMIQSSCQTQIQSAESNAAALNPYSQSKGALTAQNFTSSIRNNCSSQTSSLNSSKDILIQSAKANADKYLIPARSCLASLNDLKDDMASSDNFCRKTYGKNSEPAENVSTCQCKTGYEFNVNKTSCIEIVSCQINSARINGSCECNTGYVMKDGQCIFHTESCHLIYGDNVSSVNNVCTCNTGYQWNQNNTSCIQTPQKPVIPKITPTPKENKTTIKKVQSLEINDTNTTINTDKTASSSPEIINSTTPILDPNRLLPKKTFLQGVIKFFHNLNPFNW